jgi:hypothetical protein
MWQFLILSSCIAYSDPPAVREDLFTPDIFLVRGHVIQVKKKAGKFVGARFEIEHAYVGPTSLKGETFEYPEMWRYETGTPTVGELGIWWIVRYPEEGNEHSDGNRKNCKWRYIVADGCQKHRHYLTFGGARKVPYLDEYVGAEKLSQEIERVYRSAGPQRRKLLEKHCRYSNDRFLVEWSMDLLQRLLSKKDVAELYKKLLSSGCPIYNELALDSYLSTISPEWRVCEDRVKVVRHWMTDKLPNQEDESQLTNYDSAWLFNLPFKSLLDVALDGLLSEHRSNEFKSYLPGLIPIQDVTDIVIIDAGFDHLLAQLRRGSPERRIQAARLLAYFAPLTDKQQAAVKTLLNNPGVAPLAPNLRNALECTTQFWQYLAAESDTILPDKTGWLNGTLQDIYFPAHKVDRDGLPSDLLSTQITRGFQKRLRPALAVDTIRA